MSSAPTATSNATPHEPSMLAALLSYLIPGLGQIYQKRYGKGLLFMISLLGMFMIGQSMGQWQNVYVPRDDRQAHGKQNLANSLIARWHYVGQFWIGIAAWPALMHYFGPPPPPGAPEEPTTFFAMYQRPPNETKLNEFLVNSDKTPDLGWVYTVIAGMLNILVMYDAYAGPVLLPVPRSLAPKTEEKKEGVA